MNTRLAAGPHSGPADVLGRGGMKCTLPSVIPYKTMNQTWDFATRLLH